MDLYNKWSWGLAFDLLIFPVKETEVQDRQSSLPKTPHLLGGKSEQDVGVSGLQTRMLSHHDVLTSPMQGGRSSQAFPLGPSADAFFSNAYKFFLLENSFNIWKK